MEYSICKKKMEHLLILIQFNLNFDYKKYILIKKFKIKIFEIMPFPCSLLYAIKRIFLREIIRLTWYLKVFKLYFAHFRLFYYRLEIFFETITKNLLTWKGTISFGKVQWRYRFRAVTVPFPLQASFNLWPFY